MRTVAEAVGWDGVLDTLAERMASSLAPLMDKMPPCEWMAAKAQMAVIFGERFARAMGA